MTTILADEIAEAAVVPPPLARRQERTRLFLPPMSGEMLAIVALLAGIWVWVGSLPLGPRGPWRDLWQGEQTWKRLSQAVGTTLAAPGPAHALAEATPNWLGQLLLHAADALGGIEAVVLLRCMAIVVAYAVFLRASFLRAGSWTIAAWSTAGAFLLGIPVMGDGGTSAVGLLLVACLCWLIAGQNAVALRATMVPPLFLLWSNTDGTFLAGLAFLWLCTLDRTRSAAGRSALRPRAWLLAALAATVLSLAHPLGFDVLVRAGERFASSGAVDSLQGRPLRINTVEGMLFALSILYVAMLLRRGFERVGFSDGAMLCLFATAAAWSGELLPLWGCVLAWTGAPHVSRMVAYRAARAARTTAMNTATATVLVFAACVWAPTSHAWIVGVPRPEAAITSPELPIYLAGDLQRRVLDGKVFLPPEWEDYLLYRRRGGLASLAVASKPTPGARKDYGALGQAVTGWNAIAEHYHLRYVIASKEHQRVLARILQAEDTWRILYEDQMAILVELRNPADSHNPHNRVNSVETHDSTCVGG